MECARHKVAIMVHTKHTRPSSPCRCLGIIGGGIMTERRKERARIFAPSQRRNEQEEEIIGNRGPVAGQFSSLCSSVIGWYRFIVCCWLRLRLGCCRTNTEESTPTFRILGRESLYLLLLNCYEMIPVSYFELKGQLFKLLQWRVTEMGDN